MTCWIQLLHATVASFAMLPEDVLWNLVCERELLVPFSLAVFAVGGLLGNYIFGYFQDCFGRRPSFFIFLLVLSTCGTATAFATNFNTWLLIRFLNGLAIPAIMATPYILAVELVGHHHRTLVTVITNVAYSLTLVMLSIVVYLVREWHQLAMATTIPFVAFFLYWWVLPESPRWLLAQGQFEEVEKIVRTIAHVNKRPLPPDYMVTLKRRFQMEYSLKDREELSRRKYCVRDLFKTPNMRKKTFILTYLWFVTTSAYVGLTYYAPSLPGDHRFTFLVSSFVELPSYLVLWPCLGNLGRRWTLCLSLTIAGVACFGTVLFANNQTPWLLLLYAIGKFSVTIAFVVLPIMASELYPVAVRGIGLRFSSYISMTGSMVVPFVNQLGQEIVVLPLMMMGFILLVGGFSAAFLPETLYQRVPHTLQDGEEMGKDFSWNDLTQCCPQRHDGIEGSYQGDEDDELNYSEGRSESPLRSLLEQQGILHSFADSDGDPDSKSRSSMLTSSQELQRMPISRTPSSSSSSAAHVSYKVENSKCLIDFQMPPNALVRQISVNSSSAIDVLVRHSFNTRTDGQSLFELLKSENDENNWSGKFLKEQFNKKDLNQLFSKYRYRIRQSSFSVGLIIVIVFCIVRIVTTVIYTKVLDAVVSLGLYAVICLVCSNLLALVLTEAIIWKRWYCSSVVSIVILFMLALSDYSYVLVGIRDTYGLRLSPTYIFIILNYFFLPYPRMSLAAAVGCFLSLADLLFSAFVFYANQAEKSEKYRIYPLTADAIFLVLSNVLGVYKTYLDEVHQRRAFLDHRMCIESQIKCDLDKVQEEQLMLSVVPPYILDSIKMDIRDGIQFRNLKPRRAKLFGDFYIKKHSNVSVLFSDIVNFTVLTCTLEVQELVVLLSRLFGHFDEIASKNTCERIKIIGDCYVAASGLPPNHMSSHALNCVKQAIGMLEIIREVKGELRVNVDMRIGIHSGQVMSGILGVRKWQYDIWSKDVDFANLMEHTGKPGLIHISEATFLLLGGDKNGTFEDSATVFTLDHIVTKSKRSSLINNLDDGVLYERRVRTLHKSSLVSLREMDESEAEDEGKGDSVRNSASEATIPLCGGLYQCILGAKEEFDEKEIETYFILPPNYDNEDYDYDRQMPKYYSHRRRSSYISNRIKQSALRQTSVHTISSESTASSIEYSPLEISAIKYEKLTKRVNGEMASAIDNMALSKKEQWSGGSRINPLFLTFQKPYSEMEYIQQADPLFKYYLLVVALVFVGLFAIYALTTTSKSDVMFVPYIIVLVPLMVLVYIAWHDFIVNVKSDARQGTRVHVSPRSGINSLLTMLSRSVTSSFKARIVIWLLVTLLLSALILVDVCLCAFVDEFKCINNSTSFDVNSYGITNSRYYVYGSALVVTSVASFLHIHFMMKFAFYVVGLVTFYLVVFYLRMDVVFESFIPARYVVKQFPIDQCVYITFIVICHHLIDRQIEYLSRLDFIWKRDLRAKQEDSNVMSLVNKFLVQNIVPLHVVDHFLNSRNHNEFYHERHEKVAVMFAHIKNFCFVDEENENMDSELTSLKLLNEVITDMDNLLLKPEFSRVEKIKVIGTTYMVAAGLKPNVRRSSVEAEELEPFDVETNVVTLVNLAMAMKQSLYKFNSHSFQEYELRVGIDCGPTMAGVVGNNKPIYDVWGNAVNVASRMETTGEVGHIQVTEETAEILMRVGYECQCRGEVFVKGKGTLTTYFVTRPPSTELFALSEEMPEDYYYREDTRM